MTQKLLKEINSSAKLHVVPAVLKYNDKFVIRMSMNKETLTDRDIDISWKIVQNIATELLSK